MSAPTDVVDRLERLAAHAPTSAPDADTLWVRGRRRQRRRVGALLAGVAVVGLLGATVAPVLAGRTIAPAAPRTAMVLPDGLRQPGGWDPVFPDAPGRLSAVGIGEAFSWRSLSRTDPWWAVSATTGRSGFLDLPDLADDGDEPVLSADGRWLAYWSTGEVRGTPVVGGQEVEEGEDAAPVVGVTVLELETGERDAWEIDSTHGLFTGGMAWAGDVLWWWASPMREVDGTFGGEPVPHTWDVASGQQSSAVEDAGIPVGFSSGGGASPGGFLRMEGPRRLRRVEGNRSTRIRLVLPPGTPNGATPSDYAMSTDGSRLAVLVPPDSDHYGDSLPVLVGEVVDGRARLEQLEGVDTRDVAGWRSPTELVVLEDAGPRDGRAPQALAAWTVDVTTGERTRLIDFEVDNTPTFAADAWTKEVVPGPRAPWLADPSPLWGGAAVVLSLVLLAGWGPARRRRGHP